MSGKIIATVGISGSGKSTWVREQAEKDPKNSVIVNRDKIRELLFGYTESTIRDYFNNSTTILDQREKEVSFYEETLIRTALRQEKTVYVDNTHLREKYLKKVESYGCHLIVRVFHTPLSVCIERDFCRKKRTGVEVILEQSKKFKNILPYINSTYLKFSGKCCPQKDNIEMFYKPVESEKLVQSESLPKAIIVDIDGTLSIKGDRGIYDLSKVHLDTVNHHVKDIVNSYFDRRVKVFVFTGREAVAEEVTRKWLKDNHVNFHHLYCRAEKDFRKDSVVKKELFEEHIKDKYFVQCVIDDRMQVIRMWESLGLPVLSNNPLGLEY